MREQRVLVAAAGRGSRANLPYPKTLYSVQGRPILVRILETVKNIDSCPTIVISPDGRSNIEECLQQYRLSAALVEQQEPRGMGDAVLKYRNSTRYDEDSDLILIWGDIPFIQSTTLLKTIDTHKRLDADFTFPTAIVTEPYTIVERDRLGRVQSVRETRETGEHPPKQGERDIGLFIFRAAPVLQLLEGGNTEGCVGLMKEHGFLYVIQELVERGFKVLALPIATELDLVSLNRLSDLDNYL